MLVTDYETSQASTTHNGAKKNTTRTGIRNANAVGDMIDRFAC
jgi:hypothetical protein